MSHQEENPDTDRSARGYLKGGVYLPADFDEDGNLIVNNVPIREWVHQNTSYTHDNYGRVLRYVARFQPGLSEEESLALYEQMKAEEAHWARFLRFDELDPQSFIEALPKFKDWIEGFTGKDEDSHNSPRTIKPSRLTPFFLITASHIIASDPRSLEPISRFIQSLNDMPRTYEERYGNTWSVDHRTTPAKFVDELVDNMQTLANAEHTKRQGIENVGGAVHLAEAMSDMGVISAGYWYRLGVRQLAGPPNFVFLEILNRRLEEHGTGLSQRDSSPGLLFGDSYRLASNVLAGFSDKDNRNPQVVQAINALLQKAAEIDGRGLPMHAISVANTLTKMINESGLLEAEAMPKLEPIDTKDTRTVPLAFARLLFASRIGTPEATRYQTEYEDSVYVSLVSEIIERSNDQYDAWLQRMIEEDKASMRMMYPNATAEQLRDIARRRGRVGSAIWKKWRSGYGILS